MLQILEIQTFPHSAHSSPCPDDRHTSDKGHRIVIRGKHSGLSKAIANIKFTLFYRSALTCEQKVNFALFNDVNVRWCIALLGHIFAFFENADF
jgi:hypothetical protein